MRRPPQDFNKLRKTSARTSARPPQDLRKTSARPLRRSCGAPQDTSARFHLTPQDLRKDLRKTSARPLRSSARPLRRSCGAPQDTSARPVRNSARPGKKWFTGPRSYGPRSHGPTVYGTTVPRSNSTISPSSPNKVAFTVY